MLNYVEQYLLLVLFHPIEGHRDGEGRLRRQQMGCLNGGTEVQNSEVQGVCFKNVKVQGLTQQTKRRHV